MFGIDDPWVWMGYLFAIGLTAMSVAYGWWKWNEEVD